MDFWGKLVTRPAAADVAADGTHGAPAGAEPVLPPDVEEAVDRAATETEEKAEPQADSSLPDPTWLAALVTAAMLVIAVLLAVILNGFELTTDDFAPSKEVEANFALFAAFYVAAQVIERLMEFVAPLLPFGRPEWWLSRPLALGVKDKEPETDEDRRRRDARKKALEAVLADSAAKSAQIKADRAKLVLGVASILGVLASCGFGLFFLKAIGMDVSHTVDSIFTGIIIAAGTKPLHDFTSSIQNKNTPKTGTATS